MWADRRAIKLVEFHQLLQTEARNLIRFAITKDWSLKPADAIHLATAKRLNVTEIHTYEKTGWNKYQDVLGIKICAPEAIQSVMHLALPTPSESTSSKSCR